VSKGWLKLEHVLIAGLIHNVMLASQVNLRQSNLSRFGLRSANFSNQVSA